MTNKDFAFNYAGEKFRLEGDIVILVGYYSENLQYVIVSPLYGKTINPFWWDRLFLIPSDVITYKTDIRKYRYADLNALIPLREEEEPQTAPEEEPQTAPEEEPQTAPEEKPKTPGECIAYYGGQQGMNYSVINGCASAVSTGVRSL